MSSGLFSNNITTTNTISPIPIDEKTVSIPRISASAPAAGNIIIMAMEKNKLSTETKVALCPDGISLFNSSDCTG